MEEIVLTSVGMLKKIGHPSFKFFESKLRADVFYKSMLYWHIMKELPDNEVIGFMKEVAEFIEMDGNTWDSLMSKVHERDYKLAKSTIETLMMKAATNENVNVFMFRSKHYLVGVDGFEPWENFMVLKHMRGIPPDSVAEKLPSGEVKFKSPWQYIKEQHQKLGPQGSLIPDEYIQKQEDRIKDLKLAFETDPSWVSVGWPDEREIGVDTDKSSALSECLHVLKKTEEIEAIYDL